MAHDEHTVVRAAPLASIGIFILAFVAGLVAAMVLVSALVLAVALLNPLSIFWSMFLGGAMAACSWMPVAFASIFGKRLTKAGAFCGMLFGFLGCFVVKMYSTLTNTTLPCYLDPSVVGVFCNVIAMILVSAVTRVSKEEMEERE
ncbi:MAG: hypothetical protein NC331_00555 [Lachnospiraceae bacterium]|nr:hypothetical protein [Lachnospiraceae bacterium]MCM1237858.1 hypothetical protein [Lachnospiraceae bacterium]